MIVNFLKRVLDISQLTIAKISDRIFFSKCEKASFATCNEFLRADLVCPCKIISNEREFRNAVTIVTF